MLLQSLNFYMRYPDTMILGLQKFGGLLALLRLSIFFMLFHEKRHERVLEEKFMHYHHTVTPLDIDLHQQTKETETTEEKSNDNVILPYVQSDGYNFTLQQTLGEKDEEEDQDEEEEEGG